MKLKKQSHPGQILNAFHKQIAFFYIVVCIFAAFGLIGICTFTIFGIQHAQAANQLEPISLEAPPPGISIDDVTMAETDSGSTIYTFTVSLTSASGVQSVTVDYATANGSALLTDNDYVSSNGTITFTNPEITKTITVLVNGDTKFEADEYFLVNLSNEKHGSIVDGSGMGTIVNDDIIPSISIDNVSQAESLSGTNNLTFTVSLSHPSYEAISIDFLTTDGTATTGDSDYQSVSGILTFPENVITRTIGVPVSGDTKFETDESFAVTLSNPISATITITQGIGTILNDDSQPLIAIDDVSHPEGDAGTQIFTYTVSLSNPSYQTVAMDYASSDDTATVADNDYLAASGSISLLENQLSIPITVTVYGDTNIETTESFFVNLINASNATFAEHQGLGTILDDDSLPGLSISDVSVFEGDIGTTDAVFSVTLSQPETQTILVDYSTHNTTATTQDNDYIHASGTLTFTPGVQTQLITVTLNGDQKFELNETFAISLTNPINVLLLDDLGIGTILNDDILPQATIEDINSAEGNSGTSVFSFTVTLSNPSDQPISIDYTSSDGTATVAGNDYTPASGTLNFNAGQITNTLSIDVVGDNLLEPDETFTVTLSNPISATILVNQAIGTILNDDPLPVVSINDASQSEGDTGISSMVFTATLSEQSYQTIWIDYTIVDGTATAADNDYIAGSGTLSFTPGDVSEPITISVNGDIKYELDESLSVNLSNPVNATLGDNQGTGTILNDDAPPTISIGGLSVSEGNAGVSSAVFSVTLSAPSHQLITVDYQTADSTATILDQDYLAASGTVTFTTGQTSQWITTTINGDTKYELDESFLVNLTNPVNAALPVNQAVGLLLNDDTQPQVFIDDVSDYEGDSGSKIFTFTVSLSNLSHQSVDLDYTTADGTATVIDNDYLPVSGTVSIPENHSTATIPVVVIGDVTQESNEVFTIDISNLTNATPGDSQGTGIIQNDDGLLSINDVVIIEGATGTNTGVFSVTLSKPSDQVVTVGYQTEDEIATQLDQDYLAASGTLTFTVGETTRLITVTVNGDSKYELDETFVVNLSAPVNATFLDNQGTSTIINDDPLPTAPAGLFGVELNPIDITGGLGWITPTLTSWTKGVEIAWSDVEPNQGDRNWAALSNAIAELKNALNDGLTPIVVIGGAPEWAQKYQSPAFTFKSCGPVDAANYDEFASFMVNLIRYLGSQDVHVQYWEFWNQPEMPYITAPIASLSPVDGCWGEPGNPNYGGNDYAQMLKSTFTAVEAIDPSAQILVGGLYLECDPGNPPAGQTCESAGFINGILEEELSQGPLFHGISFQAYDYFGGAEGSYQNSNWMNSWSTTGPVSIAKAKYLKMQLHSYGINGKYLINTRNTLVDPTCTQSAPYNCPKFTLYLEETKAYYVAQSYAAAVAEGFAGNIWFDGTGTWRRNNGLLTLSQTPDPLFAYKAYDFAAQILNGAHLIQTVASYPSVRGYEFGFTGSNNHIWVLWSTSSTAQLIRLPALPNAIFDVDGTPLPAQQNLTLTTMPIYLDMPASIPRLHLPLVTKNQSQGILANGDFELGTQGWNVISQPLPATIVTSAPPSQPDPSIPIGTKSMLLGNPTLACNAVPANGYAAVEQLVYVPPVLPQQSITLEFKYIIYSQDYGANTSYDAFEILINNATQPVFIDGNLIPQGSNPCLWNRVPSPGNPRTGITSGWAVGQVNLAPYAGQTITIRFRNINRPDNFFNTYTLLDDVNIIIQ